MQEAARRAATLAARTSYGKLVAMLAARSRDIAAAEDALSQAFAKALTVWPEHGVPTNPDAWLWTVARNLMLNMSRHDRVRADATAEIMRRHDDRTTEDRPFADDRLALLFVCGHPAIDPLARTPLMLQTVLGMDAGRIGRAFMIAPAAMG